MRFESEKKNGIIWFKFLGVVKDYTGIGIKKRLLTILRGYVRIISIDFSNCIDGIQILLRAILYLLLTKMLIMMCCLLE